MQIGENNRYILMNKDQYINQMFIYWVNERYAPFTLSLSPLQSPLNLGKHDMKDELYGEDLLKIQNHVSMIDSSSPFQWMEFIL